MSTRTSPTNAAANSSPVSSVTLEDFDSEAIETRVRSGFQRTQLAPGRFEGKVLRASLGASMVDWGHYNLPLMARGEMPRERVILAILSDFYEPGNLNGHSIAHPTPVLITEGAALDYRIPAHAQWFTFRLPRRFAESVGMSLPECHAAPLAAEPEVALAAARRVENVLAAMRSVWHGAPEAPNPQACLRQLEAELLDVFSAQILTLGKQEPKAPG